MAKFCDPRDGGIRSFCMCCATPTCKFVAAQLDWNRCDLRKKNAAGLPRF